MPETRPYSVLSLFSGLGGLDLGFLWEGYRVVFASDISSLAIEAYGRNFGQEAIQADIEDLSPATLPDADVVIGGPPCQSFSLVGQRLGDDPRGRLVFRFFELVSEKRPLAFVMENVPGMAASRVNGRRLTDVLLGMFEELGYAVSLMNLVATDYLVPQRRRRLIMVGSTKGMVLAPDPDRFALERYGLRREDWSLAARDAIGDLGQCVPKGESASYATTPGGPFASLMRRGNRDPVTLHECPRMSDTDVELVRWIPPGGNFRDIPDHVSPGRVMRFKESGGRTTTYGRLHPDRPSYTINTYFRRPNVGSNFHYAEDRLITTREAMRFQSLPDSFVLPQAATDKRNALVGNAVPPLLAQAVAWSVRLHLAGALDAPAWQPRLFSLSQTSQILDR